MDIMGIMYAATLNVPMTNMLVVMPLVHGERAVFYRERSSGMYAGWMFAAAQVSRRWQQRQQRQVVVGQGCARQAEDYHANAGMPAAEIHAEPRAPVTATARQGIAELPFLFVESILYVVVVYCMVHFEFNSIKALWFW